MVPLDLRAVLVQRPLHLQGGGNGAAGGVLVSDRRTKQGDDSVALELRHRSLEPMYCVDHPSGAALNEIVDLLITQTFGDGGEPDGVGEEDGHGAALAL